MVRSAISVSLPGRRNKDIAGSGQASDRLGRVGVTSPYG